MFAAIQLLLLFIAILAANYLSFYQYQRLDVSKDTDYSLSPATKHYLKSDAVSNLEKPIQWIVAYRRTSPFYERVRALAEEYAHYSKGKIKLILVDPMRDPDRMQEINAAYGITLVRDLIIIDARNDDSPVTSEGADRIKVLNPHIKIITAEDMVIFNVVNEQRKISGFQGEDALTARLVESIEGAPRKMALIVDKSRIESRDQSPSRKALEDLMRFQNVELNELQLSEITEIPADIQGLVIVAPKYDFTDDEIKVLEHYWNQPRGAILTFIDGGIAPPHLRAFLRSNGVTAQTDRVITRDRNGIVTSARGVFTEGIDFTRDMARQSTDFGGASSSLSVRENAEDLLNRRIYPMGIIQVANGYWGETKFGQGNEAFNEQEDHATPLYLAACVTRGAQADDRFAANTSRMIVISNSDFLSPSYHRAENLDFLASSVNWLIGRESLAGIGPRSLGIYKLPLYEAQITFINRINLFCLPFAMLLIGGFVWSSRRA
jgi:hypothetical protein